MDKMNEESKTIRSVRPWGIVQMLVRNQCCSVDLTTVEPGQRASLHSHQVRSELFHFLDDNCYIEVNEKIHHPHTDDQILIRPGVKHRFWTEQKPGRILVISMGEWKAEDQVRHEDDYGRKDQPLKLE